MKLQELESKTKVQQSQRVLESYFGQRMSLSSITPAQARKMLGRVRGLIREHRQTPDFHTSERDPAYIKLIVIEQALEARVKESSPGAAPGMAMQGNQRFGPSATAALQQGKDPTQVAFAALNDKIVGYGPNQQGVDPQSTMAGVRKMATATGQQNKAGVLGKAIDTAVQGKPLNPMQRQELGKQLGGLQKAMANPQMASRLQQMLKTATAESAKPRRLREASELQQAQVVLAAQDMVDQVQGMIEDISAMQFKDLPALVNSIRNDIGMDQAQQFNNDVTAALQGLIQGLQGTKTQMESAQGILTGQAPVVPGADQMSAGAMPTAEPGTEIDADLSLDANLPAEEPEEQTPAKALGRERR